MYNANVCLIIQREVATDIQMDSKNNPESSNKTSHQSPRPSKKKRSETEAKAPIEPSNREQRLAVVGIGASAGGLEALTASHYREPVAIVLSGGTDGREVWLEGEYQVEWHANRA